MTQTAGTMVLAQRLVNNWFPKKRERVKEDKVVGLPWVRY